MLSYAARGWHVFPLQVNAKRPLRGSHGLLDATTDPAVLTAWWEDCPFYNIGVNCGRSGLWVVDVDPRNGGRETWERFNAEFGAVAPLPQRIATTPGGGLHFYFDVIDSPRTSKLGPGVDLKGAGGYVIAPPSTTLFGEYRWVTP